MIIGSEEMKYNLEFQKYLTAKDVKYLMDLCDSPNPVFGGDNNSKSITRRGGAATRKGVYENAIAKLEATSSSKFKEGQENKLNVEVPSDSPSALHPNTVFLTLIWPETGIFPCRNLRPLHPSRHSPTSSGSLWGRVLRYRK